MACGGAQSGNTFWIKRFYSRLPAIKTIFQMKQVLTFSFAFLFYFPIYLASQNANEDLNKIIEKYQNFQKEEFNNPESYFISNSPEDQQRRANFYKKILSEINNAPKTELNEQGLINSELLSFLLKNKIASIDFEDYLIPLNAEGGWYTEFILSADRVKIKNQESAEKYIEKLKAFKAHAEQNMALMKEGMQKGIVAPQAILIGRENIIDEHIVSNPKESIFYKPFINLPKTIPA
ncbi:MAG TPA: DUF885 family protein, partial [Bacteroidetes bacterium]|nr:DUF885 family protein [Bacteroidota bacterium]